MGKRNCVRAFLSYAALVGIFLFAPHSTHASAPFQAFDVLGQQNASNQPDFTTNNPDNYLGSASTTNRQGLNYPYGLVVDKVNHRLFVSDSNNIRVLEYDLDSNNNLLSHDAVHVLGQSGLTSKAGTTTQSGLADPEGLAYDPATHYLFILDDYASVDNERILIYDLSLGIIDGMNASYVLGQPDFNTGGSTTTANGFDNVNGLAYDQMHKRLFVTDTTNSRVLVFDLSSGITNYMPAAHVLGQQDFTSNIATTTQSGMNRPYAISYDSVHNRLFVDDDENARILVYDMSGGITNGMPASNVIGQPDFISQGYFLGQNRVGAPEELAYDSLNDRLFVGDDNSNRVLLFDLSSGITNGMPASSVIGATDFTTAGTGIATEHDIKDPEIGMDYDSSTNKLFMTDNSNNRVLIWKFIKISTSSLSDGTVGTSYSQTLTSTSSQGTVSWSLTSGSLPAGLSLATSAGVLSGTPTAAGSFSFTLKAQDYLSDPQTFSDSKSFTLNIAAAPASAPAPSTSGSHGQSGGGGSSNSASAISNAISIPISPLQFAISPLPPLSSLTPAQKQLLITNIQNQLAVFEQQLINILQQYILELSGKKI